jgi:hypothetical protein
MKTREQIVRQARKSLAEINQLFTDCAHWNENVRKAHEDRIDPDPGGAIAKHKAELEVLIANEIRISEPKHKG